MNSDIDLSFEFFPPRTPEGERKLQDKWQELNQLNPGFFSVTFGAGGSTREKTAETVYAIQNDINTNAAPHISCIGSTEKGIREMLSDYEENGIQQLVALRGDYPSGIASAGRFRYANDLVEFIRKETDDTFRINIAAYPEFHPEANDVEKDLENFKRKVEAGADCALTQYFFNPDAYFYFVDECQRNNIEIPIIPGIMPITNYEGLLRFSKRCGAEIPVWIEKRLASYKDDESIKQFGIEVITRLCETLLKNDAPGLHFYTLNKTYPTKTICENLFG